MYTRMWIFRVLATLTFLFLAYYLCNLVAVVQQGYEEAPPDEYQTAAHLGTTLGGGIGLVVACIPCGFFGLFALLAWRNAVGLREIRRHEEQLNAMARGRQGQ